MGGKQKIKQLIANAVPVQIKWELERTFKFLVNRNHEAASYLNISFSQEGEDLVLQRLIGIKSNGFYVDIGAHHPYRFSNTYKFYLMGWQGINIDPLPGTKALFDKKRPRDVNIEMAVLDEYNPEVFYHMFKEPAFNSFDASVSEIRHINTVDKILEKRIVPSSRLSTILKTNLPSNTLIDFFSIDVEGMDLQVIKSNDWTLFRPSYIVLESLGTQFQDDLDSSITKYLNEQQYSLVAKTINSVFYFNRLK